MGGLSEKKLKQWTEIEMFNNSDWFVATFFQQMKKKWFFCYVRHDEIEMSK